jgi:hypothetical protein
VCGAGGIHGLIHTRQLLYQGAILPAIILGFESITTHTVSNLNPCLISLSFQDPGNIGKGNKFDSNLI